MRLTLHTAPPHQRFTPLDQAPYRHIIGVTYPETGVWHPDYSRYSSPAEEVLDVPDEIFAIRLVTFFETFIVSRRDRWRRPYNCHLFAGIMTGLVECQPHDSEGMWYQAVDLARGIVKDGICTATGNLPFGTQGVLSNPAGSSEHQILHSLIGLGTDSGEFIEVNNTLGSVGMQSYTRCLSYYQSEYNARGLYSLPPSISPNPCPSSGAG